MFNFCRNLVTVRRATEIWGGGKIFGQVLVRIGVVLIFAFDEIRNFPHDSFIGYVGPIFFIDGIGRSQKGLQWIYLAFKEDVAVVADAADRSRAEFRLLGDVLLPQGLQGLMV